MSERNYRHPVIARAFVWLDGDGQHVWFSHNCTTGLVETMLPHPTWAADPTTGDVQPSIDCRVCGTHSYFNLRIDAPPATPDADDASEPLTAHEWAILRRGSGDQVEVLIAAREAAAATKARADERERIAQAIEGIATFTVTERAGHGGYQRADVSPQHVRALAARIARGDA